MLQLTDNTEGSLTEKQKQIIVGCLLGDGAMRIKTNALLEINHSLEQKLLQLKLYEQWGIETTLNKDKKYLRIRIRVNSTEKIY